MLLRCIVVGGAALVLTMSVSSCGSDSPPPSAAGGVTGTIVVFAASSLTDSFTEIGAAFEATHPGTSVSFNFAGSGDLATQIIQGAPADVFASAAESSMTTLVDAGQNAGAPVVIARNTFEIIVEPGNPTAIVSVADLARPDLVVVLCAESVPCGAGAAAVLAKAGVAVTPKSYEEKAKGVVTKVTAGEADAGIVFVTDVRAAGTSATGVEIPTDVNVISRYPIVVTNEAPNPVAARAFTDFVAGLQGQAVLASYGFLAP
ncbi:MAG: molybdate ABC transporter substrate-binding protein [Ilumatobacteraceae bacterium]